MSRLVSIPAMNANENFPMFGFVILKSHSMTSHENKNRKIVDAARCVLALFMAKFQFEISGNAHQIQGNSMIKQSVDFVNSYLLHINASVSNRTKQRILAMMCFFFDSAIHFHPLASSHISAKCLPSAKYGIPTKNDKYGFPNNISYTR